MPSPWVGSVPTLLTAALYRQAQLCMASSSLPGAPGQTLLVTRAHRGQKGTLSCPMPTVPGLSQVPQTCSFRLSRMNLGHSACSAPSCHWHRAHWQWLPTLLGSCLPAPGALRALDVPAPSREPRRSEEGSRSSRAPARNLHPPGELLGMEPNTLGHFGWH